MIPTVQSNSPRKTTAFSSPRKAADDNQAGSLSSNASPDRNYRNGTKGPPSVSTSKSERGENVFSLDDDEDDEDQADHLVSKTGNKNDKMGMKQSW